MFIGFFELSLHSYETLAAVHHVVRHAAVPERAQPDLGGQHHRLHPDAGHPLVPAQPPRQTAEEGQDREGRWQRQRQGTGCLRPG